MKELVDMQLVLSPLRKEACDALKERVKMHIDRGVDRFYDLHISDQRSVASDLLQALHPEQISYFIFESDEKELISETLVKMMAKKQNKEDLSICDILADAAASHFADKLDYYFYECSSEYDQIDGAA